MKLKTLFTSIAAVAALAFVGSTVASAESTLDIVKKRGHLRCQVGQPSPGFYNPDEIGSASCGERGESSVGAVP